MSTSFWNDMQGIGGACLTVGKLDHTPHTFVGSQEAVYRIYIRVWQTLQSQPAASSHQTTLKLGLTRRNPHRWLRASMTTNPRPLSD
jgi:hypothetical protein